MKPIKLTIQAFGPFSGTEVIDFTKLGANPLFLINGPTGAGKSTILDAICFALYSQTTGAEREASQMRCDHSELALLTEVSFEFTLGDKRYLIRRVPTQERAKSRGEGTTTHNAEAQLRQLDGSEDGRLIVSKSVSDATSEIKQLIGLGVDQFRQVMVLPQGKFRDLLMADSKERENIFSQLFETQIYKKIENRLKEQASGIKQKVERHQSEIRGILQASEVNSEPELDEELDALKPKLEEAKAAKARGEEQQKIVQRDNDHAVVINKRFEDLANKETEQSDKRAMASDIEVKQVLLDQALKAQSIYHLYSAQKTESEKLATTRLQHDTAKKEFEMSEIAHTQAVELLEVARLAGEVVDPLKRKQVELQRHEELNIDLLNAKNNLRVHMVKATDSKKTLEYKRQELELLAQELVKKEDLVFKHRNEMEQLIPEQISLEALAAKLVERTELQQTWEDIQAATVERSNGQNKVDAKTIEFNTAKKDAVKTELAWHTGQAALLAEELEENQPCPVCGSKEHPELAKATPDVELITKQQVETARQLENRARDGMQASKDALSNIDKKLDILDNKRKSSEASLGDFSDQTIEYIVSEQTVGQKRVEALTAIKNEKHKLENRVVEIKRIQGDSSEALSSIESMANEDNSKVIQAKTKVEQLEGQIPEEFREPGVLKKALKDTKTSIDDLTLKLEKTENSLKEKQTGLDQSFSKEKELLTQLNGQEQQSTKASAVWQEALSCSDFEGVEIFLKSRLNGERQSELRAEINQYHSDLDSINGVIGQLKSELEEKQRPDLEAMEISLTEKTDLYKELDKTWRELEARSKHLESVLEKLEKAHSVSDSLTKQYAVFGTLNEVANGTTGNKISLQRFVLSVLLDDVLIQASHRLNIMSKGRYQLVRKEDRAKGNKASGLELEVEDGDTGKPRSVATLSGGESFMAALSLALGLSDVVQSYAGGIKLDTLFIDEGFGSLDSESLDAAIKVLIDLQASGRTIGIISHVSELKEQMALRIDVLSGRTGSSISTIAT